MKGVFKTLATIGILASLGACSSMTTIAERDEYAQPKWYAKCAQEGSEGWFWWKEDYAYACGAGESKFYQGAEEQMYAIAMNHFAKRINGEVNSETVIDIKDNSKTTRTIISYKVPVYLIVSFLVPAPLPFILAHVPFLIASSITEVIFG